MQKSRFLISVCILSMFLVSSPNAQIDHGQGEMAGEVTQSSVILQSRLTKGKTLTNGDLPGQRGWARFEISKSEDFQDSFYTPWLEMFAQNDHILKEKVDLLQPGTRYYYRLVYGRNTSNPKRGNTCTFRTLPRSNVVEPVSFVIVTGMNYHKFHKGKNAYKGEDKALGYPALKTILDLKPDFFIGTGDNVYYDHPREPAATTIAQMRRKWHEQFVQPRFVELFSQIPTYWEKDDHDYRYDDADRTGDRLPSHRNGIKIFREQVPVVDPYDPDAKTYRTHRLNKLVQVWFTEGRDYRSPNLSPDGPDKTMWGKEQLAWLKQTLKKSDAPFKFLISPTPLVGPDDARKKDNHTNIGGFRDEGVEFFVWLKKNGFSSSEFFILCGDRHWQYHAMHMSGYEEFSCGALVDANARMGRKPRDPKSTDPEGLVLQEYTYDEPTGGFLIVKVTPEKNKTARAALIFYDEQGTELYRQEKTTHYP